MKNYKKGFIVQGIIALIALVIIGGGAYYIGTKKAASPNTIDEYYGWEVYKNEKYGFEFWHPSTWPKVSDSIDSMDNTVTDIYFDQYPAQDRDARIAVFEMGIEETKRNGWFLENEQLFRTNSFSSIVVNGITWQKAQLTNIPTDKLEDSFEYLTENNGKTYNVSGPKNITDAIVSTFKFISLNPTTYSKTYTNKEFGYSFKYPSTWRISKKNNATSIVTGDPDLRTITITEVASSTVDDSTGKWGIYRIHFDTSVKQWMVTRQSDRGDADDGIYDTVLEVTLTTMEGRPIFSQGHHGWGQSNYIVALNTNKFLIINGGESLDKPYSADNDKLLNFVRTITTQPSNDKSSSTWKTYTDGSNFSFQYPPILSAQKYSTQEGETTILNHSVGYKHNNPCDFKGDAPPLDELKDFNVSFTVIDGDIKEYVKNRGWPDWDYVSKNPFTFGSLNGFKISPGIEGCGEHLYYITISPIKTLVITRQFISEFDSMDENYQTLMNLPGVITPNQEEEWFTKILSSLKFTSQV